MTGRHEAARRESAATNIRGGGNAPIYTPRYPMYNQLTIFLSGDIWRRLNDLQTKRGGAVTFSTIVTEALLNEFEREGIA